jgi:hypothetical protein
VTALVALLCTTLVWLLAEREREVLATMDRADLPLSIVPRGVSATDLQRFDVIGTLDEETLDRIAHALSGSLRIFEVWRVAPATISGQRLPLVGLDPGGQRRVLGMRLAPQEVVPGALAARVLAGRSGGTIEWRGIHWVWDRSLREQGSAEDRVVFLRKADLDEALGTPGVSVIRLSPRAGISVETLVQKVQALGAEVETIVSPVRGSVAERDTAALLSRARHLVLGVAAALLALASAAWTSLEIRRGRREATVLTAIGATPLWIVGVLSIRTALLGVAGGLVGLLLPLVWLVARGGAVVVPWIAPDLGVIAALAALVPGLATLVVALAQAYRGRLTILELQPLT